MVKELDASPSEHLIELVYLVHELCHVVDADRGKFGDLSLIEVRNVEEGRLVKPLALHEHLKDMYQVHRGLVVTLVG